MAAKHKLSKSHLVATTAVAPDQVLEIAAQVARSMTETRGRMDGGRFFQFGWLVEGRTPAGLRLSIGNNKKSQLQFDVDTAVAGGQTRVTTEIVFFRTSQSTVFGIPSGPKKLISYPGYRDFLVELGRAIEQQDSAAVIQIIERPDRAA
jgi:hypothetical protein